MRKILIASLTLLAAHAVFADRTADIVEMFSKTKHKTKHGVSRYMQVTADPIVKGSYSGTYEATDFEYVVTIATANGVVAGSGRDTGSFTLRDGRVRGAHLTATKVYANGTTAPFEALYLRRTIREGTTPDNAKVTHTDVGLGVVGIDFEMDGIHFEKLFYEEQR